NSSSPTSGSLSSERVCASTRTGRRKRNTIAVRLTFMNHSTLVSCEFNLILLPNQVHKALALVAPQCACHGRRQSGRSLKHSQSLRESNQDVHKWPDPEFCRS